MIRKWLIAIVGSCALGLPACEDNPDQYYKKAPPGAAERWNDGRTPGASDRNAKSDFTDSYNSRSKQDLCSGAEKHERWAAMVREKLRPPRFIAGLDLAGSDAWTGLDFRDAERTLCQSKAQSVDDPQVLAAAWGDGNEVSVQYNVATNTIEFFSLNPGYRGTLDFESRPYDITDPEQKRPNPYGVKKFSIQLAQPVRADGQVYEINWQKDCTNPDDKTCWEKQLTEMFDALMYTFGPELQSTQDNCVKQQLCLGKRLPDGTAYFGARPLGMYAFFPNWRTGQPQASQPRSFFGYYVKLMPFSGAELHVKLDDEGPVATAREIGDLEPKKTCRQRLGMTYGEFLESCININRDQKLNDFLQGKLVGGMSHTKEAFDFNVDAVKLDFLSAEIGDHKTVGDDWTPSPRDKAYEFEMDYRASGRVLNEYSPDGRTFTFGGTGAIYREYARRVQDDIHAKLRDWLSPRAKTSGRCQPGWGERDGKCYYEGFGIGDPACLLNPGQDISTWKEAEGCTGFEQFITPASHEHAPDPNVARVSVGARGADVPFRIQTALKAGDPFASFCVDPPPNGAGKDRDPDGKPAICTADSDCWSNKCLDPDTGDGGLRRCEDPMKRFFKHCIEGTGGLTDTILFASHKRVMDKLGGGNPSGLPPALRDRKFYFRHLAHAIVKYLKAAGSSDPVLRYPLDLAQPEYMPGGHACDANGRTEPWGCEPEPDHLLFDQVIDNSDRDKFEYIDRRFVAPGKEPMKVEYEILINVSSQQNWRYHRKLTRPERALYEAMSTDRTIPAAGRGADPYAPPSNLRLTNLMGSVLLRNRWRGVPNKPEKDAHYCASFLGPDGNPDPECAAIGSVPPRDSRNGGRYMLDDFGKPLLRNYRGAFTGTAFTLGTSHLRMVEELPFIKSARITIPIFPDPYHPGQASVSGASGAQAPRTIADWHPETPANGIRIPVSEELDRFIPSATLSLGGSSLSLDIDYTKQPDGTLKLEAVQSDSYMGNVFLCIDRNTGDLLSVEQYESMDEIQGWLDDHPGSRQACQMITRFSAFGDYPLLLAARAAGIVLNVGLGSGVGRITNIEMYDTSLQ